MSNALSLRSFTLGQSTPCVWRLAICPPRRWIASDHVVPNHQHALFSTARKTVLSGIQPTGIPHLGNYLGALQQWVRIQDEATADTDLLYSVVDLHAMTISYHPDQLRLWKRQTLAALLAVGLKPDRSTIFFQSAVRFSTQRPIRAGSLTWSQVPAHTELMWILSCAASIGYLSRMTQWKVCLLL